MKRPGDPLSPLKLKELMLMMQLKRTREEESDLSRYTSSFGRSLDRGEERSRRTRDILNQKLRVRTLEDDLKSVRHELRTRKKG